MFILYSLDFPTFFLSLLIFFLALAVVGVIGGIIFWYMNKKRMKYKIPLYKKIGSRGYQDCRI